jgi:hypothetical protein
MITGMNKFSFARATAPAVRVLAGRRLIPIWAVVHHRGRISGRDLAVPVAVVPTDNGFIINLPFGAHTNWVRNVVVAGGCTIRWKGRDHRMDQPTVIDAAKARPYYTRFTWAAGQKLFPADAWLLLRDVDREGAGVVVGAGALQAGDEAGEAPVGGRGRQ